MDKEKIDIFVHELRKKKQMTQKEYSPVMTQNVETFHQKCDAQILWQINKIIFPFYLIRHYRSTSPKIRLQVPIRIKLRQKYPVPYKYAPFCYFNHLPFLYQPDRIYMSDWYNRNKRRHLLFVKIILIFVHVSHSRFYTLSNFHQTFPHIGLHTKCSLMRTHECSNINQHTANGNQDCLPAKRPDPVQIFSLQRGLDDQPDIHKRNHSYKSADGSQAPPQFDQMSV